MDRSLIGGQFHQGEVIAKTVLSKRAACALGVLLALPGIHVITLWVWICACAPGCHWAWGCSGHVCLLASGLQWRAGYIATSHLSSESAAVVIGFCS